jgi:putative PIN family toxin of toxin-antitoxin system
LSPRKRSRRRPRGVVDTSVLLARVAGFRNVGHNASASLLKRWVSDNTFTWLISEQILDEYKEVLARQKVRRELIGRIINLLREEASLVLVKRTETVSPDPGDDPICACAEEGDADFIVTLNPRDFPQRKLKARVIAPSDPLA